jgi:hypothetical protein
MPGRALYKVAAPDRVPRIKRMSGDMVDESMTAPAGMRGGLAKMSVFVGQRGTMLAR